MYYKIVSENFISDSSYEIKLELQKSDHLYLGYVLEAYEGICNYSADMVFKNIFVITVTVDFIDDIKKILLMIKNYNF